MFKKAFSGEKAFLSNFQACKVTLDGVEYPSVEHAYSAAKSLDPLVRKEILSCQTPGKAKQYWKKTSNKVREDWNDVRLGIMEDLVRQKFTNDASLAQKLLATENEELVEINSWGDVYWGVCNGKGENHLGKILMKIREELKD
jgi:ribA/ribD-fused uncharacterized protein